MNHLQAVRGLLLQSSQHTCESHNHLRGKISVSKPCSSCKEAWEAHLSTRDAVRGTVRAGCSVATKS